METCFQISRKIQTAKKKGYISLDIPEVGRIAVPYTNPAFMKTLKAMQAIESELINSLRASCGVTEKHTPKRIKINEQRFPYPFQEDPEDDAE